VLDKGFGVCTIAPPSNPSGSALVNAPARNPDGSYSTSLITLWLSFLPVVILNEGV
jgi:hypothetical protein